VVEQRQSEPEPDFARLRFFGGRFEDHRLYIEVLPEFATLYAVLVEVAKVVFKRRHPDRVRVPKGFETGFGLYLGQPEPGASVVAPLRRSMPVGSSRQLGLLEAQDELEEARDLTFAYLAGGPDGDVEGFPMAAASTVVRFGQTLGPEEGIDLTRPGGRQLMERRGERQEHVELVGRVSEVDNADRRFELTLAESDLRLRASYASDEDFEVLHGAQRPDVSRGPLIRVEGIAQVDARGRPVRLLATENVVEVGTRAWAEQRLDELEADEDGWFDGAGKAATAPALTAARALVERLEEAAMPYPRFSPTTEGAVEALWEHETRVLNLEIQPDGRTYLLAFDLQTREIFHDREDEALEMSVVAETWRALVGPA
jgi:hypothetical protein